jgi:hypothetical protein
MQGERREHWQELCKLAAVEQDSKKLLELTKEINRLLDEKEQKLAKDRNPPAAWAKPGVEFPVSKDDMETPAVSEPSIQTALLGSCRGFILQLKGKGPDKITGEVGVGAYTPLVCV